MGVILFYVAIQVFLMMEDIWQRYFRYCQIDKRAYVIFDSIRHQQTVQPKPYIDRGGKPINWPSNNGKPQNSKLIKKLLLTVTVADPKQFTLKDKYNTNIGAFIKLCNWKNHGQVYEIDRIVELEKMHVLIVENPRNLGADQIIEIFLVLHSAYIISSN